jgi:chromosomal replication initiation ATPase DnaA
MKLIDKYRPTSLEDVVGNNNAVNRIYRAVNDNDGFGGLVIMLTGQTGTGKTLIADIMASDIDGVVYRPDCTKDVETSEMIDQIKRDTVQNTLYSDHAVYIFDEADKLHPNNIARLKTAIDMIDRRRGENLPCNVTVIFTSAKTKSQLTPVQQGHWDELYTRCIICKMEVLPAELDAYFAALTDDNVPDISKRISVHSVRSAWEYIEQNEIDIVEAKP